MLVVAAVATLGALGCSSDGDDPSTPGEPQTPDVTGAPTLDRIDGPATVDPSYDPFAVPATTSGDG